MKSIKLKAVDFFCSGGGMTCGMMQAGIDVVLGIDNDIAVRDTYEMNNRSARFLHADICELKESELESKYGIEKNDDNMIFIGCSPCQYWSLINTDKRKSAISKDLLKEFGRFVKHFNPGFIVIENVPGLERNSLESGLKDLIDELESKGYKIDYDVYNLNRYGVPQKRKRFSLIANRVTTNIIKPNESAYNPIVEDFIGIQNGFYEIEAGYRDNTDFQHSAAGLNQENLEVLRNTPVNSKKCFKVRKSFSGKGFSDSYTRMSWNEPAPTITTRFTSISNGRFAHPIENRAISLREGATLQTFPLNYVFHSRSSIAIARMIGNAVPPEFARRIGNAIISERCKNAK